MGVYAEGGSIETEGIIVIKKDEALKVKEVLAYKEER